MSLIARDKFHPKEEAAVVVDLVRRVTALLGLAALLLSPPALAVNDLHGEVVARCLSRSAGGRVWLEKTLWALHDQERGWVGAEIRNANGTHDLGPLQVNSWWVPKIARLIRRPEGQVRLWLVHDPCFNVDVARWIFLSGLAVTRSYWRAVGIYHSPKSGRQRVYITAVARHLARRYGAGIFRR
ncbi:lytic transglycosylase domain-containing protein [Sphingomonas sp. NIBR02145]|uniref:lytic transglycosylase domain-containing protein n=1 Tax=Sphingomonas sp. NIBR02145 TaxID=3014784 RepID=UPI0022B46430|nr:lytic transglycosylase domain-containing protein [Sphingomonas sp. NIBR02145]WHU04265.1 lytic transglycosylase domain-containing protein [Sphingomonas sp. NIBR02145]